MRAQDLLRWVCGLAASLSLAALPAAARESFNPGGDSPADELPPELEGVGIKEHLDTQLPLDLHFLDENGKRVKLGDYFNQDRPVILTLNFFNCAMLCTVTLNGMVDGLQAVPLILGEDYEIVTVSFNPRETPELARQKKDNYKSYFGDPGVEDHWHLLTGAEPQISALTSAVGFNYRWDEESQQYVHAAMINTCTPDGRLSRYLYGVSFPQDTLRLSLVEAGEGKIGTPLDQVILFCFHYDSTTGGYSPAIMKLMQIFGALTFVTLALWIGGFWLRQRRLKQRAGDSGLAPPPQQLAKGKV